MISLRTFGPSTRLAGHGLRFEGRPMPDYLTTGRSSGPGRGRCECGAESDELPSNAARQRWHRQHKTDAAAPPAEEATR